MPRQWGARRESLRRPIARVPRPLTLHWTVGETTDTLSVPTRDDRRVESTETFTVRVTLPADPLIEGTGRGRLHRTSAQTELEDSVGGRGVDAGDGRDRRPVPAAADQELGDGRRASVSLGR